MHTYLIRSADGREFKVGCDCVEKTGDTQLSQELRRAERAWERAQRAAAHREWEASEEGQIARAEKDGADRGHAFRNAEYAYDRAQLEALVAARSRHVGAIGQRLTLTLTIERVIRIESLAWGTKLLHVMRDAASNRFVWFCTGSPIVIGQREGGGDVWAAEGDTVTVKATVKGHGERDGILQTSLTRVAVAKGSKR